VFEWNFLTTKDENTKKKTVETVLEGTGAHHPSLKRGVNERGSFL
jgi:hypothetical protein